MNSKLCKSTGYRLQNPLIIVWITLKPKRKQDINYNQHTFRAGTTNNTVLRHDRNPYCKYLIVMHSIISVSFGFRRAHFWTGRVVSERLGARLPMYRWTIVAAVRGRDRTGWRRGGDIYNNNGLKGCEKYPRRCRRWRRVVRKR